LRGIVVRPMVALAAICALAGVFLVPTEEAAAARVAYASAAVSVGAAVVPAMWKWGARRRSR
jgi:hypothetical protein